jgi:co-chaperonin GroES (HSP10)
MSTELEGVTLLGDGVLVKKPIIENKVGSIHSPEGASSASQLLPIIECEIVKVGPGDKASMDGVNVGDIAVLPNMGQQYSEMQFDNKTYFIIAVHNILLCKKKKA